LSLQSIINSKEKFITSTLSKFDKAWDGTSFEVQKELINIFKRRDFDEAFIEQVFIKNGYDDLMELTASQFAKTVTFSRDISKEVGYNFLLTPENKQLFGQLNDMNFESLLNTKKQIANDLRRFAIESQLAQQSRAIIKRGFTDIFDNMGRRLNTEVNQGIRMSDEAINKFSYDNAGIELFQYIGPADGKTRGICLDTLSSQQNVKGFTTAQVEDSATPFIVRGGWNCRHSWVPFTDGYKPTIPSEKELAADRNKGG